MTNDKNKQQPDFGGQDQHKKMQEEFEKERSTDQNEFTKTGDDLSLGDSIRTEGEVSGSTFGDNSAPAKFSNIGQKNQTRKGEGPDVNIEDVNKEDIEKGSGGTMYSDYLNKKQDEFISGTGEFSKNKQNEDDTTNANDQTLRPFDAMQGKRKGSGGKSENYEGYDPSGDKRPNEE